MKIPTPKRAFSPIEMTFETSEEFHLMQLILSHFINTSPETPYTKREEAQEWRRRLQEVHCGN